MTIFEPGETFLISEINLFAGQRSKEVTYIPMTAGSGIVKVVAPPYFVGKTLADAGFGPGGKRDVVVLLIQRGREAIVNPSVQEVISHVDVLLVTGNDAEVEKLFAEAEKAAEEEADKKNNNKH